MFFETKKMFLLIRTYVSKCRTRIRSKKVSDPQKTTWWLIAWVQCVITRVLDKCRIHMGPHCFFMKGD